MQGIVLPPQPGIWAAEGAGKCHRGAFRALCRPLNQVFGQLRVQECAAEVPAGHVAAPSTMYFGG